MQADHPAQTCRKRREAFDAVIRRGYEVFKPAHTGQITMEQMHIYRHQTGLRDVGISVTPEQALLACLRKISEQDA